MHTLEQYPSAQQVNLLLRARRKRKPSPTEALDAVSSLSPCRSNIMCLVFPLVMVIILLLDICQISPGDHPVSKNRPFENDEAAENTLRSPNTRMLGSVLVCLAWAVLFGRFQPACGLQRVHRVCLRHQKQRQAWGRRTASVGKVRALRKKELATRLQLHKEDSVVEESILQVNEKGGAWKSVLLLNAVAVIFGSQHAVIKGSLDLFPSTSLLNFWRFLSSALLFSPALLTLLASSKGTGKEKDVDDGGEGKPDIWRAGTELGLWTFLGFAFQAIGMETTTASKSAFLLYLNVKFVPFFASVLFGRQISLTSWTSAALALCGTFLLGNDGSK